jgi:hypothetical protein
MRRVILESPYSGEVEANLDFARRCVWDSLARGEAPFASHLFYTQPSILCDALDAERDWGIAAGEAWRAVAQATVVYVDRGISRGMRLGIRTARRLGIRVEFRTLERKKNARKR